MKFFIGVLVGVIGMKFFPSFVTLANSFLVWAQTALNVNFNTLFGA